MNRKPDRARRGWPTALAALGLSLWIGCGDAPPPGLELPLLYVGKVWGGNLAVADGQVYFTTFYYGPDQDQAVWSVPAAGGEPTLLWHGAANQIFGRGMAVHRGDLFWSQQDGATAAVFTVPIAGGNRVAVGRFTDSQAPDTGVTVGDDWIFAGSGDQIVRIPRTGGSTVAVYTRHVQSIDRQAGGPLYLLSDGTLVRLDPDTGRGSQVAAIPGADHVALAGDTAYVTAGDELWTVPLAGGPPVRTLTGLGQTEGITAGNGELFIAAHQDTQHLVLRVPVAGGPPAPIFHTRTVAPSMVVADGALFLAFCCEDPGSTDGGQVVRLEL